MSSLISGSFVRTLAVVWAGLAFFNLVYGCMYVAPVCDLGHSGTRPTREGPDFILTTFDTDQLLEIVSHMTAGDLEVGSWNGTRGELLRILAKEGFAIDGPYREGGAFSRGWYVDVRCRKPDAWEFEENGEYIRFMPMPTTVVRFRSILHGWGLGPGAVHYEVHVETDARRPEPSEGGESDDPLVVASVRKPILDWSGFFPLPYRPIKVHREPDDAAREILVEFENAPGIFEIQKVEPGSAMTERVGQSKRRAERFFAAVLGVAVSDSESGFSLLAPKGQGTGRTVAVPPDSTGAQRPLASIALPLRLLNGMDWFGILNFLSLVLFAWGLGRLFGLDKRPDRRGDVMQIVEILPMLGFLGTLYGMLQAFGSGLVGTGGTELTTFIGVSLDTTIIAVAGSAILSLLLMVEEKHPNRMAEGWNRIAESLRTALDRACSRLPSLRRIFNVRQQAS